MKNLIDQANRFVQLAERDVKAFKALKVLPEIDLASVCFHAQQAVEKALKAVLVLNGVDPTRTHDLNKLVYSLLDLNITTPLKMLKV